MTEKIKEYRVLARKYRPQDFDSLIGQDALVRTLKNAIKSGRIAHAFMLTGVRGVGKTTTARIIAKALNYKGPNGQSEPTAGDTADCPICQAISQDRHPDVIEMDAASRTGVDDIREILDGVRYAPTEARYKIYVIDEVHMLSKNAFNALLKTLEEPPEHVKFIFATTEIRKVPITVLSRCQRFDLQRIGSDLLSTHFKSICDSEGFKIDDEALGMIARAADGSVRDGLSLLDQAMALSGNDIKAGLVQDMLGLADRSQNLDLLEKVLKGNMPQALSIMDSIYKNGGSPLIVLQDLLALTHLLTKLRVIPDLETSNQILSGDQLTHAKDMAQKISMPSLSKAWQIILKGLEEVASAPNEQSAAEMVIIRLAYAANLPDPGDLVKRLKDMDAGNNCATSPAAPQTSNHSRANTSHTGNNIHHQDFTPPPQIQTCASADATSSAAPQLSIVPAPEAIPNLKSLQDIISLLKKHDELILAGYLYQNAHLLNLEHNNYGDSLKNKIEMRLDKSAPSDVPQNLRKKLCEITGQNWIVTLSNAAGSPTLASMDEEAHRLELEELANTPLVKNIMELFPDAKLCDVMHNDDAQYMGAT